MCTIDILLPLPSLRVLLGGFACSVSPRAVLPVASRWARSALCSALLLLLQLPAAALTTHSKQAGQTDTHKEDAINQHALGMGEGTRLCCGSDLNALRARGSRWNLEILCLALCAPTASASFLPLFPLNHVFSFGHPLLHSDVVRRRVVHGAGHRGPQLQDRRGEPQTQARTDLRQSDSRTSHATHHSQCTR
jgi:hypothetical protein